MQTYQYSSGQPLPKTQPNDVVQFGNNSFVANQNGSFTQQGQGNTGTYSSDQLVKLFGAAPQPSSPTPNTDNSNPLSSIVKTNTPGVVTSQGINPLSVVGPVANQPAPTPPSMSKILSESNIPAMQNNVSALQSTYNKLQSQFSNYTLSLNGNGQPQGIVNVETDATAKSMQMQLNTLSAAIQTANSNLQNALQYTNLRMQAQGEDYQTAVTAYNDTFSKALSVQQLLNSQANTNQQNASAYLSTLSSLITSGSLDPESLPAATKASIATSELQAGWPVGTISQFTRMKPGANILGSVNSVDGKGNQITTLITQNADGSYGMTNVTLPGSPVSLFGVLPGGNGSGSGGGASGSGYDSSILKGTNIDPQATVKDLLDMAKNGNTAQLYGMFDAMAKAEGGANAAGSSVNNPLDLKYTPALAAQGATDSGVKATDGGTFAAFPDKGTAYKAYAWQLSQPRYVNSSIDDALKTWSGYKAASDTSGTLDGVQSWVKEIQSGNALLSNVPAGLKTAVTSALANSDTTSYSPLAASRFSMAANRIVTNYIQLPQYQLVANGLPYLQRIAAAEKNPGSISDEDMLDSLIKLNTGGNAVTNEQVQLITGGRSILDSVQVLQNKVKNGGVLSDNQRQSLVALSKQIYANYQAGYQKVYDQATSQLQEAGIPKAFWTIPDLNNLNSSSAGLGDLSSSSGTSSIQQQATAAGYDYQAMRAANYTDDQILAALQSTKN